jgi:hypothetical protein
LNSTGLLPVLVGGAVKAGPLGPPVGAALTAPAFYGAGHNCHRTPLRGVLGRLFCFRRQSVGAGTAVASPLPSNWASRPWGSAAGHSFVPYC